MPAALAVVAEVASECWTWLEEQLVVEAVEQQRQPVKTDDSEHELEVEASFVSAAAAVVLLDSDSLPLQPTAGHSH